MNALVSRMYPPIGKLGDGGYLGWIGVIGGDTRVIYRNVSKKLVLNDNSISFE